MRMPPASHLAGCVLCGGLPVVAVGLMVPLGERDYAELMRIREAPIREDETPALCYGLCRSHFQTPEQSIAQVEALVREASIQVVVQ
jgi:hypothetical protein